MKILSYFLIITGILSLAFLLPIYFYKDKTIATESLPQTNFLNYKNATSPVRVVVDQTGIDLPVKVAANYSYSDNQAIFINTSQKIGTGNSVIYAHNWDSLFGKLGKVKTGETVTIFLANGQKNKISNSPKICSQT